MKKGKGNPNPRTDHLKAFEFKPGQSGNPGGRPKKLPITDNYRQICEEVMPEGARKHFNKKYKIGLKPGVKWERAFALAQAYRAMMKTMSLKEIREATEGKALTRLRIEDNDGNAVDFAADVENSDLAEINEKLADLTKRLRSRSGKS